MVGGVEVYGGRGGGVWWEGWRCMVGGVEVYGGRGGGVWWEEWRCMVGGVEECGGRGKVCGERGGGEWGGVEVCGRE